MLRAALHRELPEHPAFLIEPANLMVRYHRRQTLELKHHSTPPRRRTAGMHARSPTKTLQDSRLSVVTRIVIMTRFETRYFRPDTECQRTRVGMKPYDDDASHLPDYTLCLY